MVEIFRCARAEVYHNSGKKTLTQVKKETGCTHIINGYLFNSSFRPLGWTVIDGKIISRDAYRDWGVSIGADRRPVMDTDRGRQLSFGCSAAEKRAEAQAGVDGRCGPQCRPDSGGLDAGRAGGPLV